MADGPRKGDGGRFRESNARQVVGLGNEHTKDGKRGCVFVSFAYFVVNNRLRS
ncbi:hypothetical protein RSSM_00098 [Rhodopirellula sallentina SM41]|uniref:Uncharacterized protein n=1 Tax=Rhodopirellula sallentina SM41 TaxID=1263870 RepID=M5UR47_9BACT|nr:hypothetical protein RSSM_00098 [Rhodopirellula sallentina SM41]